MSNLTPNLNLFKYDVSTDANLPFSITTALNENWDKIDTATEQTVHTTGNETISGIKYFLQSDEYAPVVIRNTTVDVSNPTLARSIYDFHDVNGVRTGCMYNEINTDFVFNGIQAIKGSVYSTLGVFVDNNGYTNISFNGNNVNFVKYYVNTYTYWVRLWSDGWCEQGGIFGELVSHSYPVLTFPRAFGDTGYYFNILRGGINQDATRTDIGITSRSTTSVTFCINAGSTDGLGCWYACGQDAVG